ncbi:hypothetical protein CISIN_1g001053mg [Citrus sinensis]|uniref:Protein SCAR n=3 Tax=Citrus sinensis TaxID=2711 RepID=A0A067GQZ7_CITSI|nr:hypothetical protein CISIN_1g001053mg [Citrus sinensis]
MPLVRFGVRNEYGLGQPELYKEANKEDPKAVLDGVAVAGLVGILRQLGDLAEFAAEVFHGLQEQVMATASRSHKLTVRVQRIEAALPPLEKAVLAQTSHIHFAYTAGSEWHPRIQNEQNHFICNDLPQFIMDSYEECHNPPRLQLLDRFDAGGPGSCLKRYSDPTFFRRVSGSTIDATADKIQREKKARKKKKRSSQRNGEISRVASISNHSGRMHLTSPGINGQTSSQTPSIVDMTLKSDFGDRSKSFDSRTGLGYIDCVFNLGSSLQPGEQRSEESSSRLMQHIDTLDSDFCVESNQMVDDRPHSSSPERTIPSSFCVTWDEKEEIVEPKSQQCDSDEVPGAISANFDINTQDGGTANHTNVDGMDIMLDSKPPEMLSASFDTDTQNRGTAYLRSVDQMDILLDREYQEVLSANFDSDTQERGTAILENVDQMDILPADEDIQKSISNGDQLDEVESETDNYMDALNTIESESENDLDCQTKREVEECYSSVNNCKTEDGIEELIEHSSVQYSSSIESQTVLGGPSSNGLTGNLPDSVPSVSIVHEQTPQISAKSSDSDHSPGTDIYASVDSLDSSKVEPVITDGPKVESVLSDPSSSLSRMSNLHEQSGERTTSSFCDSQESLDEFHSVHSVKFWTNGGLLGLQPSKPPDFAVSNGNSLNVVFRGNSGPDTTSPKVEGQNEKLDVNANSYEKASSASVGKVPVSFADSDSELEKPTGSHSNKFEHGHRGGLSLTAAAASGTELASDVKATSTGANEENDSNSSLVFGFGHRLLINGFHKTLSLVHDDKSEAVSSLKTGVFDGGSGHHHDAYQTISKTAFMERFGCRSPLGSLTSSPPLEHMKISFNPVDSSETSKLKLKFPDGSQCPESVRDMFPSFQLVPEPAIPLRDYVSDSDDDTFCRSSPYMSDDCASHHSESNSEQWESSPGGSNNHELYDALRRVSSLESVSSTVQVERAPKIGMPAHSGFQSTYTENGAEPALPSLDAINPALQGEIKTDSDPNPTESSPLPPPLPPMQWRLSKPHSDVAEHKQYSEKQYHVSDALRHALDQELSGCTMSQERESGPGDQQLTNKEVVAHIRESKLEDQQKLNGKKEVNQSANGKGMDEKEDFLHQIRTKSFSLRPTVAARPTFSPAPGANVKVTAILEKANAIRQAVASDDGEDDDNWSDT